MSTATEPTVEQDPRSTPLRRVERAFGSEHLQGSLTFAAFLVLFAVYAVWLGDTFASVDLRLLDVHQSAPQLLLGLAVLITLIAGRFDLSVAGTATLVNFLTIGLVTKQGMPFGVVLLLCLAIGVVAGLANGFLHVRLGVNTFIATLATGGVLLGLSAAYSGGAQLSPSATDPQLPRWFTGEASSFGNFDAKVPEAVLWVVVVLIAVAAARRLGAAQPRRMSASVWRPLSAGLVLVILLAAILLGLRDVVQDVSWVMALVLGVTALLWLLLRLTPYGRQLQATGSNEEAAVLAGVPSGRVITTAFVIGSVLASLAGMVLAANQGSATQNVGQAYLLPAFAAAFLSTVVLSRGQLNVWGTTIGGVFLLWTAQGLIVGGVAFTWTDVVNGVVLAAAVSVSTAFNRRGR